MATKCKEKPNPTCLAIDARKACVLLRDSVEEEVKVDSLRMAFYFAAVAFIRSIDDAAMMDEFRRRQAK